MYEKKSMSIEVEVWNFEESLHYLTIKKDNEVFKICSRLFNKLFTICN